MTHPRTSPATPGADTADDPLTDPATGTGPRPVAGTAAGGTPAGPATDPDPGTATLATATPRELRGHLTARLDEPARGWLRRALDEAVDHPGTHGPISVWELRIAEAGRRCGPVHADAARVLILHAARADADALSRVYHQGTGAERRAVLYALPHLVPGPEGLPLVEDGAERRAVLYALPHLVPGPEGLPLVEDALRTNDTRLVTAAVGPYAARHLDAHAWRHAVLKCLFTGVPVDAVADLDRRAHRDTELARMLTDYAAERTAAGRAVPADLHRVLTLTDPPATPSAPATDHG